MFSANLQALRKSQHLTQSALAEELGVSQQTVAQWEKGTREPNIDTLIEIASFFGVSLDELLRFRYRKADQELDEIEKVDKREIRRFLNKLYNDTITGEITWSRFVDMFPHDVDLDSADGLINYNLSFVTWLEPIDSQVTLFYLSDIENDFTIMPEIKANDGFNTTLPPDPGTQRLLKKIYTRLEKQNPNKRSRDLSSFIQKYLDNK